MIDTVSYFNIIPYDITQFLLKFFYGLITEINFQNVLLCSDAYIIIYFSNKKYWQMIRNICLYDSWFYFSVYNRICKYVINCSRSVSRNTCWFVNCGNHSTAKHQIYKALNFFIVFIIYKTYIEISVIRISFLHTSFFSSRSCKFFSNNIVSPCGGL